MPVGSSNTGQRGQNRRGFNNQRGSTQPRGLNNPRGFNQPGRPGGPGQPNLRRQNPRAQPGLRQPYERERGRRERFGR